MAWTKDDPGFPDHIPPGTPQHRVYRPCGIEDPRPSWIVPTSTLKYGETWQTPVFACDVLKAEIYTDRGNVTYLFDGK